MRFIKPIWPVIVVFVLMIGFVASVLISTGCSTVASGSDPMVVNAERLETVSVSAFNTAVELDNSNRDFWMTNAPAFHSFCEWIRTPITIESTNTLPRGLAMIKMVDDAKVIYRSNSSHSNILIQVVADLQAALNQAQSWVVIVQSPTH
jgi:hypothetical protein